MSAPYQMRTDRGPADGATPTDPIGQTMIVKVQRPLASSESNPPWLIYNQTRTFRQFVPPNSIPAHVHKAMYERVKGYFEITLVAGTTRVSTWGRILTDREW